MIVYKFPGYQIEYLDGKIYDIQDVEGDNLASAIANGWAESPDKAEKIAKKLAKADATIAEPFPIDPEIST
jgi:hypothetical protein